MKGCETSHQCALRELFEETGISLETSIPYLGHKKLSIGEYFVYEFENNTETNPNDTYEVCDIGWFTMDDLSGLYVNRDVSCFSTLICDSPREMAIDVN